VNRAGGLVVVAAALVGCGPEPGPLGIPIREDGVVYAGAASIDVTPTIVETFTDVDGDHEFDGCLDQPAGGTEDCPEPFVDANGNGRFDPVWIGGFGPLRPANEVHDPVYARALVVAQDGKYLAFVTLDFVGLAFPRIHDARDRLAADGFVADHLIVASSHNHQGPDTMGLWGDPYDLGDLVSGLDRNYQAYVADAIEQVVRDAAAAMVPVELTVGAVSLRDVDPLYNGANFGGHSPDPIQHGLVHDGRDPVVASDQLLVLQGRAPDAEDALFTLTNWSGHPEVRGSSNNAISSDWVGEARRAIEARYGGLALHLPECLGGMQSALGGDIPLYGTDGERILRTCAADDVADAADETCFGKAGGDVAAWPDGVAEPVWAEHDSWDFVRSHGFVIADAAALALDAGEPMAASPIRVEVEDITVPVENVVYQIMGPAQMFETDYSDLIENVERCPEAAEGTGCLETRTFRIQLGDVGFSAVPGELLPELAWGLPDDATFATEASDVAARGRDRGGVWFPQHDPDCDAVAWDDCRDASDQGDCDCLSMHAVPYRLADEDLPPILSYHTTRYRAAISMTDNYLSYIIPEPDVNREVSLLSDRDGDHYEDTVTPGAPFGTRILEAHARIDARWGAAD
jgi:hypothetical protein